MHNTCNILNDLLVGEQIAVETYGTLMDQLKDDSLRSALQGMRMQHTRHLSSLTDRIVTLGGKPSFGTGIPGAMAQVKQGVKQLTGRSDCAILDELYDGEHMGVHSAQKLLQEPLDEDSAKLVRDVVETGQKHLTTLDNLLSAARGGVL